MLFIGRWSECNSDKCGAGGYQLRGVSCWHKYMQINTPQELCPLPKPTDKRGCFKVPI